MNYRLFIDFRSDSEALAHSIDSIFDAIQNITVIDNSDHGLSNALMQQCIKRGIEIVSNVLHLTPVQTMNQAMLYADELDAVLLMQNGAQALPGAARTFLGEVQEQVELAAKSSNGCAWGCVCVSENMVAFNPKVLRRLGAFDTYFQNSHVLAIEEYRYRIRTSGYRDLGSNVDFIRDWPKTSVPSLPADVRGQEMNQLHLYYQSKWGNLTFRLPFLGKPEQEWLDSIRRGPAYDDLSKRPSQNHGLFDLENIDTMIAQVSIIARYVRASQATALLEVGTGNGWFAYLLAHIYPKTVLYTFDTPTPDAIDHSAIAPDLQVLTCNHTILPSFLAQIPEHYFKCALINAPDVSGCVYQDIHLAMEANIPFLLVRNSRSPANRKAILDAMEDFPQYREDPYPFQNNDSVGITTLTCDE